MNYILHLWNYGRTSLRMTVENMKEPCGILSKKDNGEWWVYDYPEDSLGFSGERSWRKINHVDMSIILSNFDIINWGNHIFSNDSLFKLNVPSSIALASNKAISRMVLEDSGVAVPRTWFDRFSAVLPVIARPPYHHAGKKFFLVENVAQMLELKSKENLSDWYFSEIFPKTHEYRVHCAHGKVLMISQKVLLEGELRANQAVTEQSWPALKWSEFNPVVCEESLKAIEVLGLDYGAVDIMYNSKDNSVAICEVNTSPSISTNYSSGKYAAYFDWVIRHNFPEHFPIEGKSVFYNEILRS